mmetsp:Transcript_24412/g.75608  ORF Transcript_24412/g.75608 Transcript_24412/m.75608 type:complete len:217 (-) Transcript_24412:355-1005(-)
MDECLDTAAGACGGGACIVVSFAIICCTSPMSTVRRRSMCACADGSYPALGSSVCWRSAPAWRSRSSMCTAIACCSREPRAAPPWLAGDGMSSWATGLSLGLLAPPSADDGVPAGAASAANAPLAFGSTARAVAGFAVGRLRGIGAAAFVESGPDERSGGGCDGGAPNARSMADSCWLRKSIDQRVLARQGRHARVCPLPRAVCSSWVNCVYRSAS